MSEPTNQGNRRNSPLPVGILTGFLGAGKTTLLNRILEEPGGVRFGVIINEIGRIAIDPQLVTRTQEDVLELSNGCLCCTIRVDLAKTIYDMAQKGQFDYLIIETTGIAEPAPIMQTFQNIPELRDLAQIDSVVTVVDAEQLQKQMAKVETVSHQLALADFVLVNKIDLVPEDHLQALEKQIRKLNPYTQIYRTQDARIDWKLLLDGRAFSIDQKLEVDPQLLDELRELAHPKIDSVSFEYERPFVGHLLEAYFNGLAEEAQIYRAKGILDVQGESHRAIFHGVNNRFSIVWDRAWRDDEHRHSQLVFIGPDLNKAEIQKNLERCLG
ncbi:MAG: CobW family GTP-binding protein [Verrucomicrobiales bacterium]